MRKLAGKKILLGITGGIAAYKSALLCRELKRLGADVRVVMTVAATHFITPLTLQALSGHPVHCDLFEAETDHGMGHIELARWADLVIIAPASANTIAKLAHGQADDLLTTTVLASDKPLSLAPAMNSLMWQHLATQANIQLLISRGVTILGPAEGEQACGEQAGSYAGSRANSRTLSTTVKSRFTGRKKSCRYRRPHMGSHRPCAWFNQSQLR